MGKLTETEFLKLFDPDGAGHDPAIDALLAALTEPCVVPCPTCGRYHSIHPAGALGLQGVALIVVLILARLARAGLLTAVVQFAQRVDMHELTRHAARHLMERRTNDD